MALDTLTIVRRLEAAHVDRQQAEAIADVLHDSEAGALGDLATKVELRAVAADVQVLRADVQALKADVDVLKSDVQALKADVSGLKMEVQLLRADMLARFDKVDARFASLEQRMTIKLGSMIVVGLGVMAVLVKLL